MSMFKNLPEYAKELLRAIDPEKYLDRLECNICYLEFNFDDRKPMLFCKNEDKMCSNSCGICQYCATKQKKKVQKLMTKLICPFCRQSAYQQQKIDQPRYNLMKQVDVMTKKLRIFVDTTKEMTEQESEKKINEIVDRVQKNIFNSKVESEKKDFLLKRLKQRIEEQKRQKDYVIDNITKRQREVTQRQENIKKLMQGIMDRQTSLTHSLQQKIKKIENLQSENRDLKQRLSGYQDLNNIEERRRNNRVNKRKREQERIILYNDDFYYRQVKFKTLHDGNFKQNFTQAGTRYIIQLIKQQESYFKSNAKKKMIYHNQFFSINNEQDKLLCFSIKSVSPSVLRYKFGLAEVILSQYQQIKDANIPIELNEGESQDGEITIVFYVNLQKMILCATAGTYRNSVKLPTNINLNKFTVYLYFYQMNTRIIV